MPIDLARRLAEEGLISDDQLQAVVARRATSGEPVPVAIHALQLASEDAIALIFDRMGFGIAKKLKPIALAKSLPKGMLRSFWAIPIGESADGFIVAMADPTDSHVISELAYHLHKPVDPRAAPLEKLREILIRLDPETRTSSTRGRTLRTPPSDTDELEIPAAPAVPKNLPDEVITLAKRPLHRRNTPAYGERRIAPSPGGITGFGTAVPPRKAPITQRTGEVGAAIGAFTAPPVEEPAPLAPKAGESQFPIPLKRKPSAKRRPSEPKALPRDAIYTLAELRQAADRDAIGRIAARGLLSVAKRAAFFVVKRGVVQGWEGATAEGAEVAGLSRDALRNLWIPVTSPSVFRLVSERGGIYLGTLSESTADSILAAALGGRPVNVLLAAIEVRGHIVGFLYADGINSPKDAEPRVAEIVSGAAEALERWIVAGRQSR